MKRPDRNNDPGGGQMVFTYRRTRPERLAAGELRDVSACAKAAGFRWPLAVSVRLWSDVETVPAACRRQETTRTRWQHLFLLAAAAAAQVQREHRQETEINVVLRTSDAPDRSREHVKTLRLRRENIEEAPGMTFSLEYKGE